MVAYKTLEFNLRGEKSISDKLAELRKAGYSFQSVEHRGPTKVIKVSYDPANIRPLSDEEVVVNLGV